MTALRHLIVEGLSSSVDNGGAGTVSYHTLYLPHATLLMAPVYRICLPDYHE